MVDTNRLRELASAAFQQQDWPQVVQRAAGVCRKQPDDARAHYMAGVASFELRRVQDALRYLARAHQLDERDAEAATRYAKALALTNQTSAAADVARKALALGPEDALGWDTLGVVLAGSHDYEQARTAFAEAVRRAPDQAHFHYNLAVAQMALGDLEAARQALTECLRLQPHHWAAHLSLTELDDPDQAAQHARRMEQLLPEIGNVPEHYVPARVALFRDYETMGDHARAFENLAAGKQRGKQAIGYRFARDAALFDALEQAFVEPRKDVKGDPSAEPIFVLGMPRTGTTLVDRIISSHPDVYSAGELQNFGLAMKQLSGTRMPRLLDPDTIAALGRKSWDRLGRSFLESTRPNTGHVAHFVDKLPHNFLNLGYIAQTLPKATIICLRRHPMDTCLSNFRQLFMLGSAYCDYSFDLLDIGRYYLRFDQLMNHWKRLFPGRILDIHYEALVADQEAVTRRLLSHCGLQWDDACLDFRTNSAPVTSASASQVRTPLHDRNVARWKKYRPQLAELEALLADNGQPIPE